LACAAACASQSVLFAESSDDKPRPIPLTRPEMKQYLEQMKSRKPRIPLPELTAEELSKLDERAAGYEGRLRALYLPPSDGRGGFGRGSFMRNSDPQMTLDYRFKTMLFWIVSRTNNCQYCMGHQESKLLSAGMQEDEIAGLDGDWLEFSEAERAAFALARKLTYEPHKLSDADIDAVAKHYTRLQILEMVLSVAGNNSINRWKEGVGVPQSANGGAFGHRDENGQLKADAPREQSYLTPTSEANQKKITKVAPVEIDPKTGAPSSQTVCRRPTLESREEVERLLEAGRSRKPRLPMADEAAARAVVAEDWSDRALPQWVLLLASFPVDAKNRVASIRTAEEKGDMSPLAKAQASWIIARQDRAWYALGESKRRLAELGWADDRIYTLDGDWSQFTPAERALFTVAQKLAASPVVLTDEDVSRALQLAGPRDVVQWISYTTNRAAFDRITEAAGLTVGK
jgi:hypothetical protein